MIISFQKKALKQNFEQKILLSPKIINEMKKTLTKISLFLFIAVSVIFTSCKSSQIGMQNADTQLQLRTFDLEITENRTASATVTRIIGIDFERLLNIESGNFSRNGYASIFSLPVMGAEIVTPDQAYALRALIDENNGMEYDMILYPRFKRSTTSFIFFTVTETTVTAKLAKLKK